MRYMVVIERGEKSWGAHVPDPPGCIAVGETRDQVLQLIREANRTREIPAGALQHFRGYRGRSPEPACEGSLTRACTRPPQRTRRRVMPESLDARGGREKLMFVVGLLLIIVLAATFHIAVHLRSPS